MRTCLRTTVDVWLLAQIVVRQSSHDQLDGLRHLTAPTQPSPIWADLIADRRRCDAVPCELIADLRMWPADSPTELEQPRVADPEVMTHLVNDRPPNLLDDLGIAVAHRADGTPVDRDPVRQGAGCPWAGSH